ncbi:UNKNOWN [Stylonychia lemnae]|uniref:Uncharacterized protein n=1 Tax=Stylonychia lemnae TaxID=5949 RepID=A0A078B002_STYLE|nr:UNKNOWN [Stylonychia lemnae]|eukprot:CDW86757.1 UNKNOWN [Stylonychia lemnae]
MNDYSSTEYQHGLQNQENEDHSNTRPDIYSSRKYPDINVEQLDDLRINIFVSNYPIGTFVKINFRKRYNKNQLLKVKQSLDGLLRNGLDACRL